MSTHRLAAGLYETADGRFRIQRTERGEWMLLAILPAATAADLPSYEWWQTFATKTDALAAAQED